MRHIVNAALVSSLGILLGRRSDGRSAYPGLWSFPGGHVEAGEVLEQALLRELSEELAVTPVSFTLMADFLDPHALSDPATYHLFAVHEWDGHPTIANNEHSELRWFHAEEAGRLRDLALDEYRPLFARLQASAA